MNLDVGKVIFHQEGDLDYLLAQILAFMEQGKEAIITESSFQREPAKFFLRGDSAVPDNLEQRIEAALAADYNLVEAYENNVIRVSAF